MTNTKSLENMSKTEIFNFISELSIQIDEYSKQLSECSDMIKMCTDELKRRDMEHKNKISESLSGRKYYSKSMGYIKIIRKMHANGCSVSAISSATGLSKTTIYKYLRDKE